MGFRIENKYIVNFSKVLSFKKWLNEKKFRIKFPKRKVVSIYLDNKNLRAYNDSIEGVVPRKKIRIRYYDKLTDNSKLFFEEKISSVEGRFKKSKKIIKEEMENIIKLGIKDKDYGNCKLSRIISYDRSYFFFKNYRLTFDENIKFKNSLSSMLWKKINKNVFEIKTNIHTSEDKLNHFIPFEKIRFSKYCETF
jgi:hypothetical protein